MKKCRWRDRDNNWHDCQFENAATHDGETSCVLHARRKEEGLFRQTLLSTMSNWANTQSAQATDRTWNFEGLIFNIDFRREDFEDFKPLGRSVNSLRPPKFNHCRFLKSSVFGNWLETGASFKNTLWKRVANFNNVHLSGSLDLSDAAFLDEFRANWSRVGTADFGRAVFHKGARFNCFTVTQSLNFHSAKFLNRMVDFNGASLPNDVGFHGVIFGEQTDFINSVFSGDVYFVHTDFRGVTTFGSCHTRTKVEFYECNVRKHLAWKWENERQNTHLEPPTPMARGSLEFTRLRFADGSILDLRHNDLDDDCVLHMNSCEMKHVLLEGTDSVQIRFYDCRWPALKDSFFWGRLNSSRDVVGDEYVMVNLPGMSPLVEQPGQYEFLKKVGDEQHLNELRRPKWNLIRQTYQQLARRYHESLDHTQGNEFDRGAFEMRRREAGANSDWRGRSNYAWLSLYKYASHYSGSLILPAFWLLLGLLAVFPALYVLCDVEHSLSPSKWLYHGWLVDLDFIGRSVVLSLQSAFSFGLGSQTQDKLSEWAKVMQIIERLFSITLLTLFVFSMRRRFKHD